VGGSVLRKKTNLLRFELAYFEAMTASSWHFTNI
jgi:hypothetical protein